MEMIRLNRELYEKAPEKYLDDVTKLERDAFSPAEACPRERFAARLSVWPEGFWLLYDGDRLVSLVDGFMTDTPDLSDEMFADAGLHDPRGRWQMIFGVCTHPEYRYRGYAGQLMRQMLEDAKADGRKGVVLTCREAKLHYYARFGFHTDSVSSSKHGGGMWYQMRLRF